MSSCETELETSCDSESPICESGSVLIIQDGCWLCVHRNSCEPMSMESPLISCVTSSDCPWGYTCDPCARSSCPNCDDCVSACFQMCESDEEVLCNSAPPTCDESQVLIVRDLCWLCVDNTTCEP